jgi:hypothetical protein
LLELLGDGSFDEWVRSLFHFHMREEGCDRSSFSLKHQFKNYHCRGTATEIFFNKPKCYWCSLRSAIKTQVSNRCVLAAHRK